MSKILLTGGAGFIGSHIALSLVQRGFTPILVDNFSNSLSWIPGRISELSGTHIECEVADCRSISALERIADAHGPIDAIIHLAAFKAVAESVAKPMEYFENNLGCMMAVLQLMQRRNIKHLVFSSSCTVYGNASSPVYEDSAWQKAFSPYGFTKQSCERMMEDMSKVRPDFRQVSLRYFNPIGAHPSGLLGELPAGTPNNLIPYLTQVVAGEREYLTIFGNDYQTPDGTCVRDYLHVCDVADAHVRSLEWILNASAGLRDAFNLGLGRGLSILELIHIFEECTGEKVPYKVGPRRAGDADSIYANADKARIVLGWEPAFTPADALKHAWLWQQNLKQ